MAGVEFALREDPPIVLVGGSHSVDLTTEIGQILGVEPYFPSGTFDDTEINVALPNVRGSDFYAVQGHHRITDAEGSRSVNDALVEHLLIMDGARRASAAQRTAVMPYYGYARQDRKTKARTPISAAMVGEMFEERGSSRLLTVDLHSGQTQGVVKVPFDHLLAENIFTDEVNRLQEELRDSKGIVMVSPDMGHAETVYDFADLFKDVGSAAIVKKRFGREVKIVGIQGDDVRGKDCILYDDMISTGGTIMHGALKLLVDGANSVRAFATHGVFAGDAAEKLRRANLAEIVVTNTIDLGNYGPLSDLPIRRRSVAPLLAQAIAEIHNNGSISKLFRSPNNP